MRIIVLLTSFFSASCACWSAEHAQEPRCVIVHNIIDCTQDAAVSAAVTLFADLITAQGNWDLIKPQIEQRVLNLGFKDGGCLIATIQAEFLAKPRATPEMGRKMEGAQTLLANWKARFGAQDARFKVKTADGRETLQ